MASKFFPPEYGSAAFSCPHCEAYSTQSWNRPNFAQGSYWTSETHIAISRCQFCKFSSIWVEEPSNSVSENTKWRLIYPQVSFAPLPNEDMPDEIKVDYLEARSIVMASPRGAAALLRLCIQKLMPHLGENGKNINNDIKSLVEKGLHTRIQQALDFVRVIGNESVHPGTIDLNDDRDIAMILFEQVNLIVEQTLTADRKSEAAFSLVPEEKREAIARRDGKQPADNAN